MESMHTWNKRQVQPTPMLLVGPNGQGDKLTMKSYKLKMKIPPNYKQTPLWGSKLTIGKNVTCSYNIEIEKFWRFWLIGEKYCWLQIFCSFRAAKTKMIPGGTLPLAKQSRPANI